MNPFICKNLISLHLKNNSSHLHKLPITSTYSISFLFFSSSASAATTTTRPKKEKTKISLADYLINQHHFSPEAALKAASTKTYLKRPQNSDSLLLFLKESGFTNAQLEKMVKKAPRILSANLANNIKPKFKIFQDLGLSSSDIADIVSSDPWVLTRSVDNQLMPSISVLKSILGSNAGVAKALNTSAWYLKCDLGKTMMPNIDFLKSCGICSSQIVKYLFAFPNFLVVKPDRMKYFVKRVDDIGFDRKSRMFIHAIRTISSMSEEKWELRLKVFQSLGFKEDDIVSVFRRMPQVFTLSERKIREVTEMLLSRGNDISVIINCPLLLACSVEHNLKPRLLVFDSLRSKNLLPREFKFTRIFKISEKQFLEKFVLPYSDELGELSLLWGTRQTYS